MTSFEESIIITNEYKKLYSDSLLRLENKVKEIFPNGHIHSMIYNGLGSPILSINFLLIGESKDQSHRIVENDPVITRFIAHLPKISPEFDTKFKLEMLMGGLSVVPAKDSYLTMDRVRLPYRKSSGTIDKQVDKLIKYFKIVGKTVIENKDRIYNVDRIKEKYLEITI